MDSQHKQFVEKTLKKVDSQHKQFYEKLLKTYKYKELYKKPSVQEKTNDYLDECGNEYVGSPEDIPLEVVRKFECPTCKAQAEEVCKKPSSMHPDRVRRSLPKRFN